MLNLGDAIHPLDNGRREVVWAERGSKLSEGDSKCMVDKDCLVSFVMQTQVNLQR